MEPQTLLALLFLVATTTASIIPLLRRNNATASDFGTCSPEMDFQLGRDGRKATEGTFLPTDPVIAQGQQDALNPNIITNRICDQLTNVCSVTAAGKASCLAAKAQIAALGTKDASTAVAWNAALGV